MAGMERAYEVLQTYFGYSEFRAGQKTMVQALLSGRDALGIMPTGAGKSLCFQIPALLLPGITLVVSPLISLMNDQVRALVQSGVAAAYLNRSLNERQYAKALQNARQGRYKIIYVSPERLGTEGFLAFAREADISMVAVDEAHCVSHWGQDFRPSYLQVQEFIQKLSRRPVVGAFTATATEEVKEDMVRLLDLQDPVEIVTGFDRPNLYYEVQRPRNKPDALLAALQRYPDRSGIVYCATRKKVEEVCALLQEHGYPATRYHAGLSEEERQRNQEDFLFDRSPLMVATNAFGMGIDKSNVRYVIHYNMPRDMESYYQEAGRAGRDGEPADCILLYHEQDVMMGRFFIENAREREGVDEQTRKRMEQRDRQRLQTMVLYCHATDCLRTFILGYFGETHGGECGNCGNCTQRVSRVDVTQEAQIILACVQRTGQRYGMRMIADLLRGMENERLLRLGLDADLAYGALHTTPRAKLQAVLYALLEGDYLAVSEGEYPVLQLGKRAKKVLKGKESVQICVQEDTVLPAARKRKLAPADPALFERLRKLRMELAKKQSVPAYVVFTDATLEDMCRVKPKNEREFLSVSGVGQKKWEQYGKAFLAALHADRDTDIG